MENKDKDVRVEITKINNLGMIESGGVLLSLFVVVVCCPGGSALGKFQHHCFPLWCVIFLMP